MNQPRSRATRPRRSRACHLRRRTRRYLIASVASALLCGFLVGLIALRVTSSVADVNGCVIVTNPTPTTHTSCRGAQLSHTSLAGTNLSYADLSGAQLIGSNLAGATLAHAALTDIDATGADLSGVHASGVNLAHARLTTANLSNADLSYSYALTADLTGGTLAGARFLNANFSATLLSPGANRNVAATSAAGALVSFPSQGSLSGAVPGGCDHSSGATFGIGTATVTCTIRDSHGNAAMGTFVVRVTSVPAAPAALNATPGNSQVTLQWQARSDHGRPFTGYSITPFLGSTAQPPRAIATPGSTTATITGLTNGKKYTFTIAAVNAHGRGPSSAPTAALVIGTPTAAAITSIIPGNARATLAWSAPAMANGSAVTGYTVTPFVGSTAQPKITTAGGPTSLTVTGLTNARAYTFAVAAINARGTGPDSRPSAAVTVGAPAAPSLRIANPGSTTANVRWVAPANNGSAIISYSITTYTGGYVEGTTTAPASAISATVPGLAVGGHYTFTVTAKNGAGEGPASSMTGSVVVGTPTAPRGPAATPGNTTLALSWTAPVSANGSPITGYVVTPYVNGVRGAPRVLNSAKTTQTLSGLTNGRTYVFRVAAMNTVGTGIPSSPTTPVTVGTPTRPTALIATKGVALAILKWATPTSNNGSSITGYVIKPYIEGVAQPPRSFASTVTTQTVAGLISGTSYTFKVAATNGNGVGIQSFASNSIVPG